MREWSSVVAGDPRMSLVHTMTDLPSLVNVKRSPDSNSAAPNSKRWLAYGTMGLALVVAASWLGYAVGLHRGLDHLHAAAQQRLAVEAARLDGSLSRFEYLPPCWRPHPTFSSCWVPPTMLRCVKPSVCT